MKLILDEEDRLVMELESWRARALKAEAKLESINAFVDEANAEFTKAAEEDAALVEQFNG